MALEREAYRALEDIVGPEYITEEPAVLDGYCWSQETRMLVGTIWSEARSSDYAGKRGGNPSYSEGVQPL